MSVSKRKTDESECEKYLTDNLRVEGPSEEFEEYDSEYFRGPRGAYGGVVFDNRGHAIKFSRDVPRAEPHRVGKMFECGIGSFPSCLLEV